MRYKVVIKEDLEDGGYNVSYPALPGCHSQGDTIEEALESIKEAVM
ncbi:type II toxin-antitoxin system HicB family antitoxin [Methanosarcinales archaeon]|nr:MAG: type II toxin-antitoxin system HicB family antitoxin [Methanosarcinales archaeon]